jgi:ATP phosphoribosyltransferase regulatory subunit
VLRTKPDGLAHTREPLQLGAELFGHDGIESDIEIQRLMIKALQLLGLNKLHIDFSHVGIFETLIKAGNISNSLESEIYSALQGKDKATVAFLAQNLDSKIKNALIALTDLNGSAEILKQAEKVLPKLPEITKALSDLSIVGDKLSDLNVQVGFDLSELRGYHYHSGLVFAAYAQGYAGPLALGGRYDEVGQAFGRARPATGFSLDLRGVVTALSPATLAKHILAPVGDDTDLLEKIELLRSSGQVVIQELPNAKTQLNELNCDRKLVRVNNAWQVEKI